MKTHPRPLPRLLILTAGIAALLPQAFAQTPYTWNGTTGTWDDTTRWNPSGFPAALDSATINAGDVNLNGARQVVGFTMSGGILRGAFDLVVTGAGTFGGGTQVDAGTTILQGASTISGGGLNLDSGRVVQVENQATWSGGNINLNAASAIGSGILRTTATGIFIASGNSVDSISTTNFGAADNGATALFDNLGTFRKIGSAAADVTTVSAAFNNSGTVDLQTGILNLSGGGTHTGNFTTAAGTELRFGGGTHALNGGTLTIPGTLAITTGTVNWNVPFNVAGVTDLRGGTLAISGAAQTASYLQSGGVLAGNNSLTVTGTAGLSGGSQTGSGTTFLQGLATITGGGLDLDGGRLVQIENQATWSGGNINLNSGNAVGSGVLRTTATGTLIASGNSVDSISTTNFGAADNGSTALFDNQGTFRKIGSAAADVTTVSAAFSNSGTVDLQTGILSLSGGGTHTGNFTAAAGTELRFGGGTHALNGGTLTIPGTLAITTGTVNWNVPFNIAGVTDIRGGTLAISGAAQTASYLQSGGFLAGNNSLTVTGTAGLSGGTQTGSGTTFLQGLTTITGGGLDLDGGRVVQIENQATWSGGNINLNSGSVVGSGTLRTTATGVLIADGNSVDSIFTQNFGVADNGTSALFENLGTFRKSNSGANDTTTVSAPFTNTGVVDLQTGMLILSGGGTHTGNFTVAAGTELRFAGATHNLNGGTVSAPGTIAVTTGIVNWNVPFNIAGLTDLRGGTLAISGAAQTASYLQSGGFLAGNNSLTVTGTAGLSGGSQTGSGTTFLQGLTTITGGGLDLDGGRLVQIENQATWSGGNINLNSGSVVGSGTLRTTATGVLIADGNSVDSIFTQNFGVADNGTSALFENLGTFRKSNSGGNDTTTVSAPFTNTGVVDLQTGMLILSGGGTHTGNFTVAVGTELRFAGATHNLNGGTVSAPGTIAVTTGTVNWNVPFNIAGLTDLRGGTLAISGAAQTASYLQSGGFLAGNNSLTVTGTAGLSGGSQTGSGTTFLQGLTTITGGGLDLDGGRLVQIENQATWSGGNINLNSGSTVGSGVLRTAATGVLIADGNSVDSIFTQNFGATDNGTSALFDNHGVFRKINSNATDLTTVSARIENSGDVEVQTGILNLSGGGTHSGRFTISSGAELNFAGTHLLVGSSGLLQGDGRVEGSLTVNGGTVAPGTSVGALTFGTPGTLGFSNSLGEIPTIEFELNGTTPSQYDRILLDSGYTLALGAGVPTLSVLLGFDASIGDSFRIVERLAGLNAITGTFQGLPQDGETLTTIFDNFIYTFAVNYDEAFIDVGVTDKVVVPEPSAGLLGLAALAMLGFRRGGSRKSHDRR